MNTLTEILKTDTTEFVLSPQDNNRLANLCGPTDGHLRQIERWLGIEINNRGNNFRVIGTPRTTAVARRLLASLYESTATERLNTETVHLYLQQADNEAELPDMIDEEVAIRTKRGIIKGRGPRQRQYLSNI